MTFYALNDKDEELGFTPIDFLGYTFKGKKPTYLYPQERRRNNNRYLARIERDFAGIEEAPKFIDVNTNFSVFRLEQKFFFE